jgi:hypothetical protein
MKLTNFPMDFKIMKVISVNVTYEEFFLFKNTEYSDFEKCKKTLLFYCVRNRRRRWNKRSPWNISQKK